MSADSSRGWLDRLAAHGAGRPAIRFDGRVVDHVHLAMAARTLAAQLATLDVRAGDLAAVLAKPSVEGAALMHAMLDRHIVSLPVNGRLSEREQAETLRRSGARFLVVSHDMESGRAMRLARAAGCGLVALGPGLGPDAVTSAVASTPQLARLRDPDAGDASVRDRSRARFLADDAALVLYTSGTSGRSKGAVLGFDNLVASAEASARLLGASPDDRWLLCMPLFHIGGLSILVRSALVGACVVLHEGFDAARVASALEAERITRVSFVATMLEKVMAERGDRPAPASLELVLLGGGPASHSLLSRAVAAGYPIAPTYGLTEAASQVATRPPDAPRTSPDASRTPSHGPSSETPGPEPDLAAGLQPLPGVEIRIVDAEGKEAPVGCAGEIQLRGPIVMKSYLDDPEATRKAITRGWLATGDLGRLDTRGRLRVLDRRDDLIVSGGENVYPAEIEAVLVEHADIEEAGVVGVGNAEYGARPVAFVVLREDTILDPDALDGFCRERLAGYKVPDAFFRIVALPRTPTGKLLRRELSARLATA